MKQKNLLFITISSFILILIWIGFSIYDKAVSSTIGDVLNIQIQPITPNFDEQMINRLKKRKKILPVSETTQTSPASLASESAPLPSPEQTETQQSSVGGGITP